MEILHEINPALEALAYLGSRANGHTLDRLEERLQARGVRKAEPFHRASAALRELLDKYHPQFLVHGHVHLCYDNTLERVRDYNGTTLINAYERYTLELPDREVPEKKKNKLIWMNDPPEYAR